MKKQDNNRMKSFLVVGLGRFGMSLAEDLCRQGNEVLAMDTDERLVQAAADLVTRAVVGDACDPEVLRAVGARNFDCAVVAFASDVGDSALITLNLKEQGVPKVVAKANSEVHRKVLEKIGVDQVVFPEQEMAQRLARSLDNGDILNFIDLSEEYSIAERRLPDSWKGHSIRELDIRARYALTIIGLRRRGQMVLSPRPEHIFEADESLVVLGRDEDIRRLERL